jgi:uncharacterized OB-fold protein
MPASFYRVNDDDSLGTKYCTAYTSAAVPVGGCMQVSCTIDEAEIQIGMKVRMVSNDDGNGGKTTVECNEDNNTDQIVLESCGVN